MHWTRSEGGHLLRGASECNPAGTSQGIADVEGTAYRVLADMGATPLKRVVSSGGGARNTAWSRIRERALGVPVVPAKRGEASFGAALLGMRG